MAGGHKWCQENCNPDSAEEFALWAVLNYVYKDQPMPWNVLMAKDFSKHLAECGFVHDPSRQQKKFRRPHRGQQTHFNGAGSWVGMDEPDPVPFVVQDLEELTPAEFEAYAKQVDHIRSAREQ